MSEFGHSSVTAKIEDTPVCVDYWGAGPFLISAGGKLYRFEDSDRFGPHLVKKNGDLLNNPWPPERSLFWRAHWLWRRQGRQVADDGMTCLWREPKPTIYRSDGQGRNRKMVVIEQGEPDGRELWEDGSRVRWHPDDCSGGP